MRDGAYKKLMFINCVIGIILTTGCGKPGSIGIVNGAFAPCPSSPNCVCSCEKDSSHYVEPLTYTSSLENARKKILSIIEAMPRARMVVAEKDYIHAEFRSRLFRFVDDVEFQFDDRSKIINVRSASRLGYSDLGVNKKRVEEIRKKFNEKTGIDKK